MFFFALVMFMSVIGAVFGQTPATLPYSCDFEAAGDNGWTLKNGSCASKWYIGQFSIPSGYTKALFISSDGGTTAGYSTTAGAVVVAEKLFQTGTSDSLTISFDLTVEGEEYWDYLKVFWVPADTVYEASTSATYYSDTSYSTNVIMRNSVYASNYTLTYSDREERMSVTIANEPNTLKKLVFVWVNDDYYSYYPGAIIDNISIIATPTHTPIPLPYSCDFEASGDNGWTLKNGTCTNKWYIDQFSMPSGYTKALFISGNNGQTPEYNPDAYSVVVAEKTFQTGTSDSLTISFDLTSEGETNDDGYYVYDYLKVFWVPADTVYGNATSATYYSNSRYSTNVIMSNSPNALNYTLNYSDGEERMSVTIANEPNTLKKLVFVWVNDENGGSSPGAIIDNISIIATPTPTPTPLPYSCDFEASGGNGWTLKNGTCTNQWHVGSFTSPAGHSGSLFISSDGGTTASYNLHAESVVVAEKLFQTGTSDSLTISFDLTIVGEEDWDYLKVFWVPADTVYEALSSFSLPYYANASYSTNVIMSNSSNYTLSYSDRRRSVTIANEVNTLKKLVFLWRNDLGGGTQPGAIIDNISIIATPTPTPLPYSCDFEASGDNGWTLKNGSCVNKWAIANYPDATNKVLAITANSTVGYDIDERSVVVAEKLFQTGAGDSLTISFSVDVGGEAEPNGYDAWDYLKVFWVPADTVYEASTSIPYYASGEYSTNILTSNNSLLSDEYIFLDVYNGAESVTIANEPYSLKKLVFVWVNDGGEGSSDGAIIDNISIIATPTTTPTPTPLPYSCDFEAAGDNGWTLKNGTCTNQWHVGSFTSPAGHNGSLFISSDGGTTAGYNINAESVVVAEKLFQTGTGDSLTISFDLTVEGETYNVNEVYDYLKVFWVSADTVYQASTSWPYYSDASYSTNVIMSNATSASNYTLNLTNGVERMSVTIANEPNTLKKLVFVWVNDDSDGCSPGAIIDNISITLAASGLADAESGAIKAMIYPNPAKDKATLSLTGLTANAKIIVSDLQGRIIQTEDLQAGTETYELNTSNYASGVYYIRILCGNNSNTQKLIIE